MRKTIKYYSLSAHQGNAGHHLIEKNLREPAQPSDRGQERLVSSDISHPVSNKNWRSEHPVLHPVSADGRGSALKMSVFRKLDGSQPRSAQLFSESRKNREKKVSQTWNIQSYNLCLNFPAVLARWFFIVRRDYEKYFWIT